MKICTLFTLFAAALALCTASSVLAQDANSAAAIDFSTDIAATVVEDRSADALARAANAAAVPDVENRSVDSITTDVDTNFATGDDAVGNDADADDTDGGATTTNEDVTILGADVLGKWTDLELNDDAVQVLIGALKDPKYYDPTIKAPVCVLEISSATFQTVSGTNYRYEILGCPINFADELGACRNRECASSKFDVAVYQQTWTNTLQVSSIAQSAAKASIETTSTDVERLEAAFQQSMEMNVYQLAKKGSAVQMPWPSSYWPTYRDGINYQWKQGQPSPAAKYATAFGLNVQAFTKTVSQTTGVLSQASRTKCYSDFQCSMLGDGSTCARRIGESQGFCIPTWFGICHAWAPAAILEVEPSCAVTKNGVTFQPMDIKALLTQIYDGAELATVFTGVRFNGPDQPATKDKYGRFTDAARRDLGPGFLHIALGNLLGKRQHTFILDVSGGAQVWNQPVYSYEILQQSELTLQQGAQKFFGARQYPFNNRAKSLMYMQTKVTWMVEASEDGALVKSGRAKSHTQSGTYTYLLELDASKNILGGEWVGASKNEHPDFLWFAAAKPADSTVTSVGLSYANVKDLLAASLQC